MRTISALTLALAALAAAPASAQEAKIYPYATSVNYCPSGLQPITLNGVICCGQPNQSMSYQQVMRHHTRARKYTARTSSCPEGTKGCS